MAKKGFSEGWATRRADGTPHFFRRDGLGLARSICGAQDAPAGWLSMGINLRCCERSARLRDKELSKLGAIPPEAGQDARGEFGE